MPEVMAKHDSTPSTAAPGIQTNGKNHETSLDWVNLNPAELILQFKSLEDRIKQLELPKDTASPERKDAPEAVSEEQPLLAEVRWCNYERFKNRYYDEEERYSIEAMTAGRHLSEEVKKEIGRRDAVEQHTYVPESVSGRTTTVDMSSAEEPRWLERVRVQSKAVLRTLDKVMNKSSLYTLDAETPTTFLRPFAILVYFQPAMKDAVRDMKERRSLEMEDDEAQPANEPAANGDAAAEPSAPKARADMDLDELECYVNFVDKHIMSTHERLRGGCGKASSPQKVYYDDLWHLFHPGDLVYAAPLPMSEGRSKTSRKNASEQRIWRVCDVITTKTEWKTDKLEGEHQRSRGRKRKEQDSEGGEKEERTSTGLELHCYYLDYNGESFCPVNRVFEIDYFDDKVDITSLRIYPVRFAPNNEAIIKEETEMRRRFLDFCQSRKHLAYQGWSINTDVTGAPLEESDNKKNRQYIDSEVIIDFEETFQTLPEWRPQFFWCVLRANPECRWLTDPFAIMRWNDRGRSKLVSQTREVVLDSSPIATIQSMECADKDKHLTLSSYNSPEFGPKHRTVSEEELPLLPTRLFAYAFRNRKFVQVDIRYLRPIELDDNPFGKLQIDPSHKTMVESLMRSHLESKKIERSKGPAVIGQDMIRGKGRGLVILLHGSPGVGKTATAEAVAQYFMKPLFAITCGDLGADPTMVEDNMTEIFRLARTWDCVLLLDEADVFLTKRQNNELERNALVSVLLRILEYYDGILFLTTNRPGALDEAVTSRVHLSLQYPPLSLEQTREIFKINLHRLKLVEQQRNETSDQQDLVIMENEVLNYAEKHYNEFAVQHRNWNGRQIRNAFQIAASLARYEESGNPKVQPQLRSYHFEKVAEATEKYAGYRADMFHKTDSELAKEREDRYDEWNRQPPADMRQQPQYNYGGQYNGPQFRPYGPPGGFSSQQMPGPPRPPMQGQPYPARI